MNLGEKIIYGIAIFFAVIVGIFILWMLYVVFRDGGFIGTILFIVALVIIISLLSMRGPVEGG